MARTENRDRGEHPSRRAFLRTGLLGVGGAALPPLLVRNAPPLAIEDAGDSNEGHPERILVVIELSGGNDGLDTVIPYGDDAYQRARPMLRHAGGKLPRAGNDHAFHPSLAGLARIWSEGRLAIVAGCGYPRASRSHFAAMEHWQTAAPHAAEALGWIGRLADACWREGPVPALVNIGAKPSLAVRARRHLPFVFSDPDRLAHGMVRTTPCARHTLGAADGARRPSDHSDGRPARGARDSETSSRVRDAIRRYRTPVSYGSLPLASDLRKIAALIAAGFSSRVYYTSVGGFDTHASQASGRARLLTGVDEALVAFDDDLRRIGRDREVATLVFSEFGRRLEENASLGTDHGTAGPVFVMGAAVVPGFHGKQPSLTDLEATGDLRMTTDFRRVYATIAEEWFGLGETRTLLRGDFETLGIFT